MCMPPPPTRYHPSTIALRLTVVHTYPFTLSIIRSRTPRCQSAPRRLSTTCSMFNEEAKDERRFTIGEETNSDSKHRVSAQRWSMKIYSIVGVRTFLTTYTWTINTIGDSLSHLIAVLLLHLRERLRRHGQVEALQVHPHQCSLLEA